VIQNETNRITATGGTVTADDLIEVMSKNWRISSGCKGTSSAKHIYDGEPPDVALSNVPGAFTNRIFFNVVRKDTWLKIASE